jgi:hypothetical protein
LERDKDPAENAETTPGPEDGSDLHCLWALEFYTPSEIEGLKNGLAALGWVDRKDQQKDRNSLLWLERSRSGLAGREYMYVSDLLPPGKSKHSFDTRPAVLPDRVDYATAYLFSLTSSVTCFVVCFVFEEKCGAVFDAALRDQYSTTFEPLERGWTIVSPRSHKERRIRGIRHELRRSATSWFRTHLPGVFCGKGRDVAVPTCELTILKGAPPRTHVRTHASFSNLLGFSGVLDAWHTPDLQGVKFMWQQKSAGAEGFHAALVAERQFLEQQRF